MPDLAAVNVERTFDAGTPVRVLRGVSLTIEQGEYVAIEGPSGGGKSTLLNIIGSLDRPTTGAYIVDGEDTAKLSERALARLRSSTFGFVFQGFHLLDRRLAIESVELGLVYRGLRKSERQQRALRSMQSLGIEHLAFVKSTKLSGGERQRVALARALASETPVIIADEPTGNLDSENAQLVVDALHQLNQRGTTVVLVTHSPEVAATAQRRLRIKDGVLEEATVRRIDPTKRTVEATPVPGTASTVRVRDLLADAVANITSRLGKTAGLVAAVALAVALTVGSLGIAGSASAQVSDRFDAHVNRDVTVEWRPEQLSAQPSSSELTIPERLKAVRGVAAAAVVASHGQTAVAAGSARSPLQVIGFTASDHATAAARMKVTWASEDHSLAPTQVLVGSTLARQLALSPIALGPVILINGTPYTVAGLVTDSPRLPDLLGGVMLNEADTDVLAAPDRMRALILTSAGAAQQVAKQAPLVVNPYSPSALTVSAPSDPRTLRTEVQSDVSTTLAGLTALALLAAIAGLTNAMILAVIERRQEYGLRRAIGAKRSHIFGLVIGESTFIGLLGGVAGLVLGLVGVLTVTITQRWTPVFDLRLAPVAVVGGVLVGAVGGLIAAARAASIDPSEALRL